jgi:hypothetical protein
MLAGRASSGKERVPLTIDIAQETGVVAFVAFAFFVAGPLQIRSFSGR